MMETYSEELAAGFELVKLCRETGARSGWIQHRAHLIEGNLMSSDQNIEGMCRVIDDMCVAYMKASRQMETFVFTFGGRHLVVACDHHQRVVLLFPQKFEQFSEAIPEMRTFIRENRDLLLRRVPKEEKVAELMVLPDPKPGVEKKPIHKVTTFSQWDEVEEALVKLLSNVTGPDKAQKLVDNTVKKAGLGKKGPNPIQVVTISRRAVAGIPDRDKTQALMAELNELLHQKGFI